MGDTILQPYSRETARSTNPLQFSLLTPFYVVYQAEGVQDLSSFGRKFPLFKGGRGGVGGTGSFPLSVVSSYWPFLNSVHSLILPYLLQTVITTVS